MKGTGTHETKPHLKTCCKASFVCKHLAHEGGKGRERRENRKVKESKRRCSQLGHKRPRAHQEKKRRVPSYDESFQGHPSEKERKKGEEKKERKREREREREREEREKRKKKEEEEGGVPSYETSVQGHTKESGVPECCIQEYPKRQRKKRKEGTGRKGMKVPTGSDEP